jgi:hypothetical protein
MPIDLPLESMTVAEKLSAMEAIWESLCSNPLQVESPAWHEEVLAERKMRLENGQATVSDWDSAKRHGYRIWSGDRQHF